MRGGVKLLLVAVPASAALTGIAAHALAAYWVFYHLDTPGAGLGLVFFVMPCSFLLSMLSVTATFAIARRRGSSFGTAIGQGVVAAYAVVAIAVAVMISDTASVRGREGGGASLAPYVLYHVVQR
jgi:hypothetical protein